MQDYYYDTKTLLLVKLSMQREAEMEAKKSDLA
jgi:hypothetical protein